MKPAIFLSGLILILLCPLLSLGQRRDTVLVDAQNYSIKALQLPGSTLNVTNYSHAVREAASRGGVLKFDPAQVGKLRGCSYFVVLKNGAVQSSGVAVKGAKAAKRLRKQLIAQFGSPYNLDVYKQQEVLEWRPSDGQPFVVRCTSSTDDTRCTAWVSLR